MLRMTPRSGRERMLPAHQLPSVRTDDGPLVVWRTWLVVPDISRAARTTTPMLTGLMGFPWRGPELDAKCTIQVPNPGPNAFTRPTIDRHHRRIPDPDCTCGLYAGRDDLVGPPMRLVPRGVPIATGFVELSGHILETERHWRAGHARILGPLHLLAGRIPVVDALAQRTGLERSPRTVGIEHGTYRVRWSRWSDGIGFAEWRLDTARRLSHRYEVDVA